MQREIAAEEEDVAAIEASSTRCVCGWHRRTCLGGCDTRYGAVNLLDHAHPERIWDSRSAAASLRLFFGRMEGEPLVGVALQHAVCTAYYQAGCCCVYTPSVTATLSVRVRAHGQILAEWSGAYVDEAWTTLLWDMPVRVHRLDLELSTTVGFAVVALRDVRPLRTTKGSKLQL